MLTLPVHLPRQGVAVAFYPHHVEHLAPLCQMFDVPLLATTRKTQAAAMWYPGLRCATLPASGADSLAEVLEGLQRYGIILWSHFFPRADLDVQFKRLRWQPRVVYCPHGFSEKNSPRNGRDTDQDIRLLYRLTPADGRPRRIIGGDLPRWYYEAQRAAFDARLPAPLVATGTDRTVVYAPTYDDPLKRSSLAPIFEDLVAHVPAGIRLIVKPHPILCADPRVLTQMRRVVAASRRSVLIEDCPLTHALLSRADALISDMSSMAYLFLAYGRPLILLNQNAGRIGDVRTSRLAACSTVISPDGYGQIWTSVLRQLQQFQPTPGTSNARVALYDLIYGSAPDVPRIASEIAAACIS